MRNGWTLKPSKKLWKKTTKFIPLGVQTSSKAPSKFVEGEYPLYLRSAKGCYVYDLEFNQYIDYPLGLGAILLGHSFPAVNEAVIQQVKEGYLFTLPTPIETTLAELLHDIIPSAEMIRICKTGSEATSAAVKIARSFTGREKIFCCGYHGWHDWFTITTTKSKGIPKCLKELTSKFKYNDIDSLKALFDNNKGQVAAVILEPCIYDEPKDKFLHKVIDLAHSEGALVIFDEVVTGFRMKEFSAQKYFRAVPDLSCFGKAMANGMPISCVVGRRGVMEEIEGDCFFSTTFGGEAISIAAAIATIRFLINEEGIDKIWEMGQILKDGYNALAEELKIDTKCIGYPCRTMFMFPTGEHKSLFWQECIRKGVLFGYAQFISYSHGENEIFYTLEVIRKALIKVKKYWDNPLEGLDGLPAEEVFRLVATR